MQNKLQPRLASTGVLRIGKNREDGGGGRGGTEAGGRVEAASQNYSRNE